MNWIRPYIGRFIAVFSFLIVALTAWAQDPATPSAPSPEGIEFFETSIRPILAEHCVECHGPEKQKSGLRLDTREDFFKGGDSGVVVHPGNAGASLMLHALRQDGELKMPPAGKLDDAVIAAVEQWIVLGAPWPEGGNTPIVPKAMPDRIADARAKHWAFQPVAAPPVPAVQQQVVVANPIDAFVQAKLEANGLTLSPRADAHTLLRRLSFGVEGLAPSPERVQQFLQDSSPEAYARLVEELLASPRYGERWGRYWLDLARYADTKGYVFMEDRNYPYSYTYRDYVIRAFNEDLPFDQFIRHQLAADQMDLGEDKRPLAGLGFLTLGRRFINNIHDITDDRIDVVTRGLLGLTVSCARCHDHKYDPVSAEDYYALYGVFRSASEPAELPVIQQRAEDDPQYIDYKTQLAEKQKVYDDYLNEKHIELLSHAREKLAEYVTAGFDARDMDDEALRALARDRALRWPLVQRWRDRMKAAKEVQPPDAIWGPLWAFAALPTEGFEAAAAELGGRIAANADPAAPYNSVLTAAFRDAAPKTLAEAVERYARVFVETENAWKNLIASETQIAQQRGTSPTLSAALPDPAREALRQLIYGPGSPPNMTSDELIATGDVPLRDGLSARRNAILAVKATHPGRPDCAQVMVDNAEPFNPYVFLRGKPSDKGPEVPRRFLSVLAGDTPKPFEKGSGRLELADAIVARDNPLTARVLVNRVWAYHFGKPLVASPSDFGVRSDPPTHPELLDFLANYLMENQWSIKALQRLILTSDTYQQASADVAEALALDPENRLLWRQNRKRLDFEGLRDSLLLASGGLDLNMGGPAVDITTPPFAKRRTVYSFIDRQNLPGVFRTFDFASPDAHSPRRYLTTVPQQALFMMNSPFVVEQARALAARPEVAQAPDLASRVRTLYTVAFQREPAPEEAALGERFLSEAKTEAPQPSAWSYGYGTIDTEGGSVTAFNPYPHFGDGAWKGSAQTPDPTLGWALLTSGGGHPGKSPDYSVIRRWTAPSDGVISITGELTHGGEMGDGVFGYVVASNGGILWRESVKYSKASVDLQHITVKAGDHIDFVVNAGADEGYDGFGFAPRVKYTEVNGGAQRTEWDANIDFEGPKPPPLEPLEQYAQVLLLSNEFAFVD